MHGGCAAPHALAARNDVAAAEVCGHRIQCHRHLESAAAAPFDVACQSYSILTSASERPHAPHVLCATEHGVPHHALCAQCLIAPISHMLDAEPGAAGMRSGCATHRLQQFTG